MRSLALYFSVISSEGNSIYYMPDSGLFLYFVSFLFTCHFVDFLFLFCFYTREF